MIIRNRPPFQEDANLETSRTASALKFPAVFTCKTPAEEVSNLVPCMHKNDLRLAPIMRTVYQKMHAMDSNYCHQNKANRPNLKK